MKKMQLERKKGKSEPDFRSMEYQSEREQEWLYKNAEKKGNKGGGGKVNQSGDLKKIYI